MFLGRSRKQRSIYQDWHNPNRTRRSPAHDANRYPLADPYDPGGPFRYTQRRIIIAWGDCSMPNTRGRRPAPCESLYRHLVRMSKQMGRFPEGHRLQGQQRLIVLKINENYSSQIPSCWPIPENNVNHPPLPNGVPPVEQRLQDPFDRFGVRQCPHCHKIWDRDVNACRYIYMRITL